MKMKQIDLSQVSLSSQVNATLLSDYGHEFISVGCETEKEVRKLGTGPHCL